MIETDALSDLIPKAEVFRERALVGQGVDFTGHVAGGFPNFQVFKVSNGHT
jgi:hypothetical protein